MPELELTRSPDDRRLFTLAGVGTLRVGGWLSRAATAEAGAARWQCRRRSFPRMSAEATDASGSVVGSFSGRPVSRGGTLSWGGRDFELRPSSRWRERYALVERDSDSDHELLSIQAGSWGKRPVRLTLDDAIDVEPGLLLFVAYVTRALAQDAAASGA